MLFCSSLPAGSKVIVNRTPMETFRRLVSWPCWLCGWTQTERISWFDSRITVNTDGSMQVVETIVVESAGIDIVHGIYRDFPLR